MGGVWPPLPAFEHSLWICEVEEIDRVGLELGKVSHRQRRGFDLQESSLVKRQVLHHPVGDVDLSLIRHEFEDAAVGGSTGLQPILIP